MLRKGGETELCVRKKKKGRRRIIDWECSNGKGTMEEARRREIVVCCKTRKWEESSNARTESCCQDSSHTKFPTFQ